ncbi:MAG TPA: DUF2950 domain-containing protein [Terriglobales bacterium]
MRLERTTRKLVDLSRLIPFGLAILLVACNRSAVDETTMQKVFASPEAAGQALVAAGKSGNQDAILAIFGPGSKQLIYTGDAVQDKQSVDGFLAAYGVMNRWRKIDDSTELLIVGADNVPFPIPLRKNDGGQWYFDTQAGREEILARRVGRNELAVIDVCLALADAQAEYFAGRHDGADKQYALKFISDKGKQNGLYWESAEGQPRSPLGPLVAFATSEGYNLQPKSHEPFHGYYFRILEKQGSHANGGAEDYVVNGKMVNGFGFVAYPAEYSVSGVMTFIVNQDGIVYQKDLGKTTADTAAAMTAFDPDSGWAAVQE